jgi:hypothetical protein
MTSSQPTPRNPGHPTASTKPGALHRFTPQPVRERAIPKAPGKVRSLGIPTTVDRVVQASLKLVLEADFKPCSYGFRPKRRAQDAIAEINFLGSLRVIEHPSEPAQLVGLEAGADLAGVAQRGALVVPDQEPAGLAAAVAVARVPAADDELLVG